MPRRQIRKYLPTPERLRNEPSLRWLGTVLRDPNLWHLNRRSLSGAAFIGVFSAMLPIPFQMIVAALLAMRFKCNLPAAVLLVWISNPVTYVPIFYFNYRVGAWLRGLPMELPERVNAAWFIEQMVPLWIGSLVSGLVCGMLAFATVRLLYRMAIQRSWERRRQRRIDLNSRD